MAIKRILQEDEVRDGYTTDTEFMKGAKQILEFDKPEPNVKQNTGQIYTFNQLGFTCEGSSNKPDGWYLPNDTSKAAIILETKSSDKDIYKKEYEDELLRNCSIVATKYDKVIGILYNSKETRVFKNNVEDKTITKFLQPKSFYLELFTDEPIDTQLIYNTTMKINNLLHFSFGVNDYYDRMIFTACALVAKRYGAWLDKGRDYTTLHNSILNTLSKSLSDAMRQNEKLKILIEMYSKIQMNITTNQAAIDEFIDCVELISSLINSNNWNGEDVMAIFFNEFNRYKVKAVGGQVFTPEHITSLMYRLIEVDQNDRVLDACCGSGAFLTKSMANMIKEAGGPSTLKAKQIMAEQLYGIEIDKHVYSLACANMLIHKDGKTNLEQMDATSDEAKDWIKSKGITKVLMNPPYENRYNPGEIVVSVLDNIVPGSMAAFLLPDTKLDKFKKDVKKHLNNNHRLLKIIKLPENTFDESTTASIFIFESGKPQNGEEIFTCYIKDDGLERVKNQGRQDINHKWKEIENYWVKVIKRQSGDDSIKWIDPKEHLSYQKDPEPFSIYEEDFIKTMTDFLLYKAEVDVDALKKDLFDKIVYSGDINLNEDTGEINISLQGGGIYE